MSDIEVYVQSSGFMPEQDYSWITYKCGKYLLEKPPYLNDLTFLIQSEAFSIVLALYEHDIVLLVTGLKAGKRRDFHSRQIRNSILWKCDDKEACRNLAVAILQNWRHEDKELIESISASVEEYNSEISGILENNQNIIKDTGFTFDYERLVKFIKQENRIRLDQSETLQKRNRNFNKNMIAKYKSELRITRKTLNKLTGKIEKSKLEKLEAFVGKEFFIEEMEKLFSRHELDMIVYHCKDQNRRLQELIYDLQNVRDLPKGPVVVFTDKKSKEKFVGVWRALSSLVENEEWINEYEERCEHKSSIISKAIECCEKEVEEFVKNPKERVNKYGEYLNKMLDKADACLNTLDEAEFCRAKKFLNTQEKRQEFKRQKPDLYKRLEPLLDKLNGKTRTPVCDLLRQEKIFDFNERKFICNHFCE